MSVEAQEAKVSSLSIKGLEPVTEPETVLTRDEILVISKEVDELRKEVNDLGSDVASLIGEVSNLGFRIKSFENSWRMLHGKVRKLESIVTKESRESKKASLVAKLIGQWKAQVCKHGRSGICDAWRLGSDVVKEIKEVFGVDAVKEVDGELRIVPTKVPHLCAVCPLFKMSKE